MSCETNTPQKKTGIFCWNELITTDVAAAKKFYAANFGWESEDLTKVPGCTYTLFKQQETVVAGMFGITPEMGPIPPHWLSYISCDDVAAAVEKAKTTGAKILKDTTEIPNTGIFAVIQDPQGAVFALWKCQMSCGC